jgi:predicted TIM-barrel fold metal-dependent hydrolase
VDIQVAHLAGADGYEFPFTDPVLDVFGEAIARNDPRAARLWFDACGSANARTTSERAAMIVRRIRQLGLQRMLFGSDAPTPTDLPRDTWAAFRALPLTEVEFRAIATNIAPVPALRDDSGGPLSSGHA